MMKKVMKQVISGLQGPQQVCIEREILAAAMLRATNTVNNVPNLDVEENIRQLAPADFVTPW